MTANTTEGVGNGSERVIPQGNYRSWVRHGDLVFLSGLTPRVGGVMLFPGTVGEDVTFDQAQEAAIVVANRILDCLTDAVRSLDSVVKILALDVFIASSADFVDHGKVADKLSAVLAEFLGEGAISSRTAVGVVSLPGGAPIEAKVVAIVGVHKADTGRSRRPVRIQAEAELVG